jgi:hypothetical protein
LLVPGTYPTPPAPCTPAPPPESAPTSAPAASHRGRSPGSGTAPRCPAAPTALACRAPRGSGWPSPPRRLGGRARRSASARGGGRGVVPASGPGRRAGRCSEAGLQMPRARSAKQGRATSTLLSAAGYRRLSQRRPTGPCAANELLRSRKLPICHEGRFTPARSASKGEARPWWRFGLGFPIASPLTPGPFIGCAAAGKRFIFEALGAPRSSSPRVQAGSLQRLFGPPRVGELTGAPKKPGEAPPTFGGPPPLESSTL